MSDNEIYLLIKYIKSVLWRVVKRLSYIEDARCLKVNIAAGYHTMQYLSFIFKSSAIRLLSTVKSYRLFEEASCLHLKGSRNPIQFTYATHYKDGGDKILRNVFTRIS